jgi:hypothetical protein
MNRRLAQGNYLIMALSSQALLEPAPNVLPFPSRQRAGLVVAPVSKPDFNFAASCPLLDGVSFSTRVVPRREWRPEQVEVFMNTSKGRLMVDLVESNCLPQSTPDDRAIAVREAYVKALLNLKITFAEETEKPQKMAGWTVEGAERSFIMRHKGISEVMRQAVYIAGFEAHTLLGHERHQPTDMRRAQLVFNRCLV